MAGVAISEGVGKSRVKAHLRNGKPVRGHDRRSASPARPTGSDAAEQARAAAAAAEAATDSSSYGTFDFDQYRGRGASSAANEGSPTPGGDVAELHQFEIWVTDDKESDLAIDLVAHDHQDALRRFREMTRLHRDDWSEPVFVTPSDDVPFPLDAGLVMTAPGRTRDHMVFVVRLHGA